MKVDTILITLLLSSIIAFNIGCSKNSDEGIDYREKYTGEFRFHMRNHHFSDSINGDTVNYNGFVRIHYDSIPFRIYIKYGEEMYFGDHDYNDSEFWYGSHVIPTIYNSGDLNYSRKDSKNFFYGKFYSTDSVVFFMNRHTDSSRILDVIGIRLK